ncbi:sigma-54-dependent Fis family transcriptional regulator [Aliiglaciecola sp. 2_MG-2023]|uniref:sigma-54-dependent Fis family transcriptional regulator n=1 Tax=unclassified Aliiglaciecola TaxID=2593648 RepID=UPI0026E40728|nr:MULTISPECIES: sigma-54-dependent Fis family transcriptional regulator [unclassified Aliiglaciecola]MDO6711199.1 sigma-54-dependent Fis family transcriptional regulator [Aliiglaciecola sp. 2_MG-2023]MDO6752113.1 sigma-54-dependent Fis family transcriptional regulator [Aliiglaciecola sp. 1_MG-2023]
MRQAPQLKSTNDVIAFMTGNFQKRDVKPNEMIVNSWQRSILKYGLDPHKQSEVEILSSSEMQQQLQRQEDFLNIAKHGVTGLAKRISNAGFSVVLTDETGLTLDAKIPNSIREKCQKSGLRIGAGWSEKQVGTNGIGTCLAEKESIIVHQHEHFFAEQSQLSCSVTPIFDPMGELRGCLNASCLGASKNKENQFLTLQMVMMYGRMIENSYFRQAYRNQITMSIKPTESFADLIQEQLLAVNERGIIVGANRSAFAEYDSLLPADQQLPGSQIEDIVGQSIDELLTKSKGGGVVVRSFSPKMLEEIEIGLRVPSGKLNSVHTVAERKPTESLAMKAHPTLQQLAGEDPVAQSQIKQIMRVINKDIPFLITGETGTGKEAFARAIHRASDRSDGPFIALNCAAIPESLIESELFGYRSGTFTGANKKGMKGKLELAHGGTIFLDEIGDMPIQLQTRLLRVLAERETIPLGASEPTHIDIQVISATHQNLHELIGQKLFREDFYYRLNGMSIELPNLRDRKDKDFIINYLLNNLNSEQQIQVSEQARSILHSYHWPGNIRQLVSALKFAEALSEDNKIEVDCLPKDIVSANIQLENKAPIEDSVEQNKTLSNYVGNQEGQHLLETLKKYRWNITQVSEELNICRSTVYRKMRKYNIVQPNEIY